MTAASFAKAVVARQGLAAALAYFGVALLAPLVLELSGEVALDVLGRVAAAGALATLAVVLDSWWMVSRQRYLFRALALGGAAIEPHDIDTLRRLPQRGITRLLVIGLVGAVSLALPFVRPTALGAEIARELALLAATVLLSAAVPAYVSVQAATSRLLEQAPHDAVLACLEGQRAMHAPARRSRFELVFAVVVPVVLVGVGGVLTSHAHLRSLIEARRTQAALGLGRGVADAVEGTGRSGPAAAIEAARTSGYEIRSAESTGAAEVRRRDDDRFELEVPLDHGAAIVAFDADLPLALTAPLVFAALAFAWLAAASAYWLARLVSRDMGGAVRTLRSLGTDAVLEGRVHEGPTPRLDVVRRLSRGVGRLTDRFRVFAAAQERTLDARENARRARGLFFASVSHDLRSPLNAILGFADGIEPRHLTPGQRESVDVIRSRGRELVALIETILDAARVEAGQLSLVVGHHAPSALLAAAARRAREIAGAAGESEELAVEASAHLPDVAVDLAQAEKALAVIAAHALRSQESERLGGVVVMRATRPEGEGAIRIEVEPAAVDMGAAELAALFARRETGRARGLVLGLSLARSIVMLHGGTLTIEGGDKGRPRVVVRLPIATAARGA